MKAQSLLLAVLVSVVVLCCGNRADAQNPHPIVNRANHAWQVGYDAEHPNKKHQHHAARLVVHTGTINGDNPVPITATLYRFDGPKGMGMNKKYDWKGRDKGGDIPLGGVIYHVAEATDSSRWKRAHIPFVLVGFYEDGNGMNAARYEVKVSGTLYLGNNTTKHAANEPNDTEVDSRDDDRVTFVVKIQRQTSAQTTAAGLLNLLDKFQAATSDAERQQLVAQAIALLAGSGSVPCDDAPPMDAAQETEVPLEEGLPDYTNFTYVD